jgi:hypothetical protein
VIRVGIEKGEIEKAFHSAERNTRFAVVVSLTRTAWKARGALVSEMKQVFDRPTRFTLNSLSVHPATMEKPEARVWFKPMPRFEGHHYVEPHVFGANGRILRRFEKHLQRTGQMPSGWYAVPGEAVKLDAHGNIPASQYVRILSVLNAFPEGGYLMNRTAASIRRRMASGKAPIDLVVLRSGPRGPGIYVRDGRDLKQLIGYVPRVAYRKRFDFFGVAAKAVATELPTQFRRALRDARDNDSRGRGSSWGKV